MEEKRVIFTKEMKKTHKILIPSMAPIHFSILREILITEGYDCELLTNQGHSVIEEGLKYVHNDTCYPALVVIGQMIEALKSGEYDINTTAVTITQTGGGCRASNYLKLLRKALKKAGFENVPVLSINMSGLEKNSSIQLTIPLIKKLLEATIYGDLIMHISNQVRPYELEQGQTDNKIKELIEYLSSDITKKNKVSKKKIKQNCELIVKEFSNIKIEHKKLVKVGVVGEIFVKYSNVGNNNLEQLLQNENCEVRVPGLMGFIDYCISQKFDQVNLFE